MSADSAGQGIAILVADCIASPNLNLVCQHCVNLGHSGQLMHYHNTSAHAECDKVTTLLRRKGKFTHTGHLPSREIFEFYARSSRFSLLA